MEPTQVGNPNKDCFNPLLETAVPLALAVSPSAGTAYTNDVEFTVDVNRGAIRAIEIYTDGTDLTELSLANISISVNSTAVLTEIPLIAYSSGYTNQRNPIICNIPEQSKVKINGSNLSLTDAFNITIKFLYYDPYVISLKSIIG